MKRRMNVKKIILVILVLLVVLIAGCTEADRVSSNVSKEADLFNVTRRIEVINARTDKPLFELIGNFSLKNNSTNELAIIVEVAPNVYKKHFVYLNEWTLYVVEDVSGAYVDKYHYEVNFLPEMIMPVTITNND
jgi:hypothetical protein